MGGPGGRGEEEEEPSPIPKVGTGHGSEKQSALDTGWVYHLNP